MTELTAIQGRVLRPIGLDTFADITDVRLVLPDGIDRFGLLFAGPLDDDQIDAIHDRMTSRDDTDAAERAHIAALVAAEENPLLRAIGCRLLGLPLDPA